MAKNVSPEPKTRAPVPILPLASCATSAELLPLPKQPLHL